MLDVVDLRRPKQIAHSVRGADRGKDNTGNAAGRSLVLSSDAYDPTERLDALGST